MVDRRAVEAALRFVAEQRLADTEELRFLEGLCERTIRALEVDGAGAVLNNEAGEYRHAVSTGLAVEQLARMQLKTGEGPVWECVASLRPIACEDLAADDRWPALTELATEAGVRSLACFPLALADRCYGALSVVTERVARLGDDEIEAGVTLATAAAGLVGNARDYARATELAEQLETALRTRIVIEQAKGMLAARLGMTPDEAFDVLRRTARNRRERLHDLSREVIAGVADIDR